MVSARGFDRASLPPCQARDAAERDRASVFASFYCIPYGPDMAAANASARGQRATILASPLHELTGFYLAVDCLAPRCAGERTFAVAELESFYSRHSLAPHAVLQRLRWARGGGMADDRAATQCTRQATAGCR